MDAWAAFDESVRYLSEHARTRIAPNAATGIRAGGSYLVAETFAELVPALILIGQVDDAKVNASLAEEYSLIAISKKTGHKLIGPQVTADMAKGRMWYHVYESRWLLQGTEDEEALRNAMEHLEVAVAADSKARRARFRESNAGFLAGLAARLGMFDVACRYAQRSNGLVTYCIGCESKPAFRSLFLAMCGFLSGNASGSDERTRITDDYREIFQHARAGDIRLTPIANGTYDSLRNLAYFGAKHFDELRGNREFTFEGVIRSIRE